MRNGSHSSEHINQRWKSITHLSCRDIPQKNISAKFLKSHNLKAASSVGTALKMLQNKEIVVRDGDAYRVHDILFMRWMQQL